MNDQTELAGSRWWTHPRFVVSAVVVALLTAVGLALAVWPGPAAAPALETAPPASPVPAGSGSVCGLNATGGRTLTKAPRVAWEPIGATDAPSSAEHGPGRIDGMTRVRSCYSHTPEGALLAAV